MLQFISWPQFIKFITLGIALYYGWVLLKYFDAELKSRIKGNRKPKPEPMSKKVAPEMVQSSFFSEISSPVPTSPIVNPSIPTVPAPIVPVNTSQQLFKEMETVIVSLKEAFKINEEGNKPTRTEILEKTKAILTKFRQLRKTPYEAAINSFLTRTFLSDLPSDDLEDLWS